MAEEPNTPETKEFPTLLVASTMTGIGLGDGLTFSDVQECAEHLFGGPVWTHELAYEPIYSQYKAEALRQFPDMPTREEAEADYKAAAKAAVERYGQTVSVKRGNCKRDIGPVGSIAEMMGHSVAATKGGEA